VSLAAGGTTACQFRPAAEAATGTGSGGTTGIGINTIPGLTALTISPATASLTASPDGAPQTLQYSVTGTVNGRQQDVTGQVSYMASPDGIVSVSRGGLVTTQKAGGLVTVTATAGTIVATATIKVTYAFSGADPSMTATVPADAATKFVGAKNDATRAPELVYPNDGVLFPPNVSGVEIHFRPGSSRRTSPRRSSRKRRRPAASGSSFP